MGLRSHSPLLKEDLQELFEQYFQPEPNSGCWLWLGQVTYRGEYGIFNRAPDGYIMARAHRVSWEIYNNIKLNPEIHVLHSCDTPICVNPDHLFLGDQAINMYDKAMKGRQLEGEANPAYKHGMYVGDKKNPDYPQGIISAN